MADLWLPGVERIVGNSAGAMDGDGSKKILLHSTEGTSIDGAIGAYRANNSWSTLTVDCPERRVVEHLPLNVAARSLRNLSGGVETNREGSILVQIELVGFAGTPSSIGSPADLDWLGAEVLALIAEMTGVPLVSTVRWVAYPASYGQGASQRLSPSAWDSYNGVLGHQHAPENDHGDPGLLDVARILAAAQPEDDDMPRPVFARDSNDKLWLIDGQTRRLVDGDEDVANVRRFFNPQQENGRAFTSLSDSWIHRHVDVGVIATTSVVLADVEQDVDDIEQAIAPEVGR